MVGRRLKLLPAAARGGIGQAHRVEVEEATVGQACELRRKSAREPRLLEEERVGELREGAELRRERARERILTDGEPFCQRGQFAQLHSEHDGTLPPVSRIVNST
jgi:hypothetical protein